MIEGPLRGRTALITGASSGIGAATAEALAADGAAVAIAARRSDRRQDLAERIRSSGGTAMPVELDVADERACHDAVARVADELGGPDVLVNSAGVMLLGPVVGAETEDWRRMMSINVLGLMYVTQAALPGMLERGHGDVVNISSVAGRIATVGSGVYNASKWAVNAFSESLRQEVTERGVRISLVEPGAVATELNDHITDERLRRTSQERYAAMRTLEAEDVAAAIRYLVGQPAHVAVNEILVRPTAQSR